MINYYLAMIAGIKYIAKSGYRKAKVISIIGSSLLAFGFYRGVVNNKIWIPFNKQKSVQSLEKDLEKRANLEEVITEDPISLRNNKISISDQTVFDLLIPKSGLAQTILLVTAINKGLKVCLIEENDFKPNICDSEPFLVSNPIARCLRLTNFIDKLPMYLNGMREAEHALIDGPYMNNVAEVLVPVKGFFKASLLYFKSFLLHFIHRLTRKTVEYVVPYPGIKFDKYNKLFYVSLYDPEIEESRYSIMLLNSKKVEKSGSLVLNHIELLSKEKTSTEASEVKELKCKDKITGREFTIKYKFKLDDDIFSTSKNWSIGYKMHLREKFYSDSVFRLCKDFDVPISDYLKGKSIFLTTKNQAESAFIIPKNGRYLVTKFLNADSSLPQFIRDSFVDTSLQPKDEMKKNKLYDIPTINEYSQALLKDIFKDQLKEMPAIRSTNASTSLNNINGTFFIRQSYIKERYQFRLLERLLKSRYPHLPSAYIDMLISNYGADSFSILAAGEKLKTNYSVISKEIKDKFYVLQSEIDYALRFESVLKPSDYLIRKINPGDASSTELKILSQNIASAMKNSMKWSDEEEMIISSECFTDLHRKLYAM